MTTRRSKNNVRIISATRHRYIVAVNDACVLLSIKLLESMRKNLSAALRDLYNLGQTFDFQIVRNGCVLELCSSTAPNDPANPAYDSDPVFVGYRTLLSRVFQPCAIAAMHIKRGRDAFMREVTAEQKYNPLFAEDALFSQSRLRKVDYMKKVRRAARRKIKKILSPNTASQQKSAAKPSRKKSPFVQGTLF